MGRIPRYWSIFTMLAPHFCRLPLWEKPTLLQMGSARHGSVQTESYHLPGIWSLHHYEYNAQIELGTRLVRISPGSVTLLPPGIPLSYSYEGPSVHQFAHFVLPASADRFCEVPMHLSRSRVPPGFQSKFLEAIELRPTSPGHAEIRLWDLLWDLTDAVRGSRETTDHLPDPVRRALAAIEARLADTIRVPEIAKEAQLSQNQLNRLFHRSFGHSIITAVRRRRTERAIHLLRNTDLPFKTIASASGLGDPHTFNKTIRAMTRHSPTEVRAQGPERRGTAT
jgi:AraC-like DNA-binding protein